jgi:Putative zinc-finger
MHWLNKHARIRDRLSPYLDGALSPAERTSLEGHLSTCEACYAELDELRLTAGATHELPEVEAPRSFALTPEMLEGRRTAAPVPSAPPLAFGMRLASAGVAVLLAVVVIGDLSDAGGGGGGGGDGTGNLELADESRTTMEFAAEAERDQAEGGAAVPVPEITESTQQLEPPPPAADAATSAADSERSACPPVAAAESTSASGTGAGGGGAGGGAGGTVASPEATPIAQPSATPTPDVTALAATGCEAQPIAGAVAPTTSAPTPHAAPDTSGEAQSTQGAPEAEGDGGVSTLRVLEIVLGGALIALLAGIAFELALRRRAV